ncbi:MAG: hypothetical protein LRZ84_24740 [Desertifilum sp.]|nr:hypothetical protein [Desertifilum sp.]MDI9639012.1 hypothetical protein [Geitlerinema splendidum]
MQATQVKVVPLCLSFLVVGVLAAYLPHPALGPSFVQQFQTHFNQP